MGIIQRPKRITTQGVESEQAQEAVDSVGLSVNTFIEEVYNVISGRLTISDNLDQDIKTLTVTVDANGNPKKPTKFSTKTKANGLLCIRAFKNTVISMPFISFSQTSDKVIEITNISGLQTDKEYQLVIYVIGS